MLKQAVEGKESTNILEGMACPGGCIGGAGILSPIRLQKTLDFIRLMNMQRLYLNYSEE